MNTKAAAVTLILAFWLAGCASATPDVPGETSSPPPSTASPAEPTAAATPPSLLQPERVVTGDVADWPGAWSPDSRFYVFFRWSADASCSGESIHAYDTKLERDFQLSSADYCTRDVDPDLIWEDDNVLLLGDGPDGARWEAVTLDDEIARVPLDSPPPTCVDRDIALPPALEGLPVSRARWSPDESLLAVAVVPDDEAHRFDAIPGNRPDLRLFQRLDLALFPADGAAESDLRWLGPIFDLGPDTGHDEDCPGTQLRWSEDGQAVISSMGPVIYEVAGGDAILAPDGPNAGPLGPNIRWSSNDWLVADDRLLLDLRSGAQHILPGILPGYDRGFAGSEKLIYVSEAGLNEYDVVSQSVRQLTDFRLAVFVVAPDGSALVYADDGDLWMIRLHD